jgi:hypothetical protein
MNTSLVPTTALAADVSLRSFPAVPWRDPHTVSSVELSLHIQRLEQECLEHPRSANLRTCLGLAYAMNYDVYRSMDALEAAISIDPMHFWAQMKYAELHYRLRTLLRAEEETLKALALAENPWQLSVARKQLQEVRRLRRDGARNVAWTKPLLAPMVVFSVMIVAVFVVMMWR